MKGAYFLLAVILTSAFPPAEVLLVLSNPEDVFKFNNPIRLQAQDASFSWGIKNTRNDVTSTYPAGILAHSTVVSGLMDISRSTSTFIGKLGSLTAFDFIQPAYAGIFLAETHLVIGGKLASIDQFFLSPPGPECDTHHWHAANGSSVTAVDGTTLPDPGGCGYGKFLEVERAILVTEDTTVSSFTVEAGERLQIEPGVSLLCTNLCEVAPGGKMVVFGTMRIADGATMTVESGGFLNVFGTLLVIGLLSVLLGGTMTVESGGFLNVFGTLLVIGLLSVLLGSMVEIFGVLDNNAQETVNNNGIVNINPGGIYNNNQGSTTNNNGVININSGGTYNNNAGSTTNNNGDIFRFIRGVFNNLGTLTGNQIIEPPENLAPVADTTRVATFKGRSMIITLTGSDADGDALTFSILRLPAHGTLGETLQTSPTSATVVYTPDPGYAGRDMFIFKAHDGKTDSNNAIVSIIMANLR